MEEKEWKVPDQLSNEEMTICMMPDDELENKSHFLNHRDEHITFEAARRESG